MVNLKTFVGILKLTEETAQNLGLQSLTPMDRFILTAMWEKYEKHENGFPLVFDDFAKATIFAIETARIAFAPSSLLFFVPSSSSRI